MHRSTITVLKALIVLLIALLLVCQFGVIPQTAQAMASRYPELAHLEAPGIVIGVMFVLCAQVVLVCVWRLLSLIGRDRIFSPRAFAWVDLALAAVLLATILVVVAFLTLFAAQASNPGITLLCFIGIVVGAGLSLLIVVLRGLLRKASQLEQDLSEVV